jgi:hypothetical protein
MNDSSARAAAPQSKFHELTVLDDPDGVIAPITMSEKDGSIRFSFALMREFDKNGEVSRTAFLNKRHIAAAIRLLERLAEAIDAEEDKLRALRRKVAGVRR